MFFGGPFHGKILQPERVMLDLREVSANAEDDAGFLCRKESIFRRAFHRVNANVKLLVLGLIRGSQTSGCWNFREVMA